MLYYISDNVTGKLTRLVFACLFVSACACVCVCACFSLYSWTDHKVSLRSFKIQIAIVLSKRDKCVLWKWTSTRKRWSRTSIIFSSVNICSLKFSAPVCLLHYESLIYNIFIFSTVVSTASYSVFKTEHSEDAQ